MSDAKALVMAVLRRIGPWTLVRIGVDPGRALTNAQPTTTELRAGRAEQLALIRQRMDKQAVTLTRARAGSTWPAHPNLSHLSRRIGT
jgi:hypothetical protein